MYTHMHMPQLYTFPSLSMESNIVLTLQEQYFNYRPNVYKFRTIGHVILFNIGFSFSEYICVYVYHKGPYRPQLTAEPILFLQKEFIVNLLVLQGSIDLSQNIFYCAFQDSPTIGKYKQPHRNIRTLISLRFLHGTRIICLALYLQYL